MPFSEYASRFRSLRVLFTFLLLLGTPRMASGRPPDPEIPPAPAPTCADVLRCQLAREIALTDRFLRERRYGLPFTLDPRPLDYPLEMLRLNVMSQAMGYLNLHRLDRRADHLREALARVDYLLALGDAAMGNGPRDGMYGYLMLDAYELTHDARYLEAGRRAAVRCAAARPDELTMNGGLMCALNHAFLARLDGSDASGVIADGIVERTSPKQFEDGAFPHQPYLESGRNTNYSAWMANELLMLRSLRPQNELTEYLAANTIDFLRLRVGASGEIVYRDSLYDYASDPGGGDTRGWTSELASIAFDLGVSGRRDEAARVLTKLFGTRMKGEALGGYPDKYAYVDPRNAWESGRPSVLRTSLVFWFLTLIRRYDLPCGPGTGPCVSRDGDCPDLYRELGLCEAEMPGTRACIAGIATRCYDAAAVRMRAGRLCDMLTGCAAAEEGACYYFCPIYGSALCVGEQCRDQCLDQTRGDCKLHCVPGRDCTSPQAPDRAPSVPAVSVVSSEWLPLGAEPSLHTSSMRDDLSLQLLAIRGAATGEAVLRVNHHGARPALGARVSLARANGEVLTSRVVALAPHASVELALPCGPCDSLVARLDAGAAFGEADTLNNVAIGGADVNAGAPEVVEAPERSADAGRPLLRSRGALRFEVWSPREAPTQLSVHDVAGRRVRVLWDGVLPEGTRTFEWDGIGAAGHRADRGVYFVRLVTPDARAVTRAVILR